MLTTEKMVKTIPSIPAFIDSLKFIPNPSPTTEA